MRNSRSTRVELIQAKQRRRQEVGPGLLVAASSFAMATTVPGRVTRLSPPTTDQTTTSTAKVLSISSSVKVNPRVAKASSPTGTAAKGTHTPASSRAPLALAATSTLRKLSELQTSDCTPGKAVSDRTRKKTNANEITDEEWIVVRERLANVKESLTHVTVQRTMRTEAQEMMETYVAQ